MADNAASHEEEKERRRTKQHKKMGKILAKAWQLDEDGVFQDSKKQTASTDQCYCLSAIGQKIDAKGYRLGRHGWEDFSRDLGGVFNRHVKRKTKNADVAKEHLSKVCAWLGAKDGSFATLAAEYVPKEASNKKRKSDAPVNVGSAAKKQRFSKSPKKKNKNSELAEREERALNLLESFIQERGGQLSQISGFTSRVTKKASGKFDTTFFNEEGRRFRSMLEVGRFLKLVDDGGPSAVRRSGFRSKKASSREQEAEKKKLRKELERLRKQLQRASKSLDDFTSDDKDTRYPVDDLLLLEEEASKEGAPKSGPIALSSCAAAREPDIDGFPGFPQHCIADVLMSWDFLCTFQRALSLSPIALDDFASALAYMPPEGQVQGDDVLSPPVFLAEMHLALLRLLFQDRSGEDWWWSTLESPYVADDLNLDETEEDGQQGMPVIHVNIAALLAETEDPLITTSWLKALEPVEKGDVKGEGLRRTIKTAINTASNKWVAAYLRKALAGYKASGATFAKQAVVFLLRRVRQARPDLFNRSVSQEDVFKERAKVVEEVEAQMKTLSESAPLVKEEDVVSDVEDEEDEESDESDDEDAVDRGSKGRGASIDESDRPASSIPPKPLPTTVDLLLPPEKPVHNSDYLNPFTWSQMVGATALRVLHRRKRVLNEVDDSLRLSHELRPLNVGERQHREKLVAARVLTECAGDAEVSPSPLERAIDLLCQGGSYLQLEPVDRLCIVRLLIEAAYGTGRLFEIVDGNFKQRLSAVKQLDVEQRRAKREAKEKASADEAAAREQLAAEARDKFLDEKREEIRQLNERSKEFSNDIIESLTEEDIIDFDDDIKADYEALPAPESFSKAQVTAMVNRMREEAAFDTDALRVLTMDELLNREKRQLEELEEQFQGFGGEETLLDPSLDRETSRSIERLKRDIDKAKAQMERLPELRENAIEQLKDAIQDGTIKVLRSAIAAAKKAKLSGPDDETGGVWAVDLMRDAALELENAKQNKRVADAQKDLISKRNKCFIRSEPTGLDRFRNRFWTFDNEENGHVWVEAELTLRENGDSSSLPKPPPGFLSLERSHDSIAVGANDMEEDLVRKEEDIDRFRTFCRLEYHSSGSVPSLSKEHWGCHASESFLRAAIKSLDGRGTRERELRNNLKEVLEEKVGSGENQESAREESAVPEDDDEQPNGQQEMESNYAKVTGDETVFQAAKEAARGTEDVSMETLDRITSAIDARVRVRQVVSETKDGTVARYETGRVTGWKVKKEEVEIKSNADSMEEDEGELEQKTEIVEVPVWQVETNRGHVEWLTGSELVQSISRFEKFSASRGYFENDSVFLSYRNSLGRFCGRAADAPYSSSPIALARLMVKHESELYPKLKIRSYDNSWGGQSGARALWTNSMKDYAFDFQTVKQGLLTLENAFFELTGEFSEYADISDSTLPDAKALLNDPATRVEIELEAIERDIPGLWFSPASRAVFIEIVSTCQTTGVLALALDLLSRNTMKYLQRHRLLNVKSAGAAAPAQSRNKRRMNAWQQANQAWY